MRSYTVAAAAFSLGISPKVLDNVLVRFEIGGVSRARQGVARRITARAVTTLDIAFRLAGSLRMPLGHALRFAGEVVSGGRSTIEAEKGITLSFELRQIMADVDARLADAVEIAPVPRRGRPPRRL